MKRFFAVLGSLLVLPAFAEVAPVYYDEIVEYTDDMIDAIDDAEMDENVAQQQNVAQRPTTNRTASRATGATRSAASTRSTAAAVRNAQKNATRGTVARTAKSTSTQKSAPRSAASRTSVTSRLGQTTPAVKARVGAYTNVVPVVKSSSSSGYVTNVSDSGNSLYLPTSSTSRVGVASRRATARVSTATTPIVTETDISTTTSNLDAIAELTDYCKAQYAACMDNYCNVLDDNQGRCSCSKNLKNYQKVEEALATATENFQDTVQKIKYIGLSADQVTSLFNETEAELQMKSSSDSSQLKNSLDSIKKKIIDASSSSGSSSYAATGVSLNVSGLLDIDLASGFDLGSFLNMNTTSGNANSVSNQRGEQLYKTASARCKTTVLNSCTAQGIEAGVITNSYDLEIDKQCIAYERSLNEANDEMRNNVRNAATILQQARLMLAQNKNSYDFRGCVAAIDSCMQDEYVCGADYELCLDPSAKYLADGEVIKGGTPGVAGGVPNNTQTICEGTSTSGCVSQDAWTSQGLKNLYSVWDYKSGSATLNAFGGGVSENLGAYIDNRLENWEDNYNKTTVESGDMATYLLQKIGYIDTDDRVHGMCASVMKQCQDYTYSSSSRSSKKYLPNNEVIRQYLASTLNKIKSQQDALLADYAEDCRSDVTSCLSTNGYDESNTTTTASKTAINACRSEIQTCMSVSGYHPADGATLTIRNMSAWVETLLKVCSSGYYLKDSGTGSVTCEVCPTGISVVDAAGNPVTTGTTAVNLVSGGGQETVCHCPDGYTDFSTGSDGQPNKCTKTN